MNRALETGWSLLKNEECPDCDDSGYVAEDEPCSCPASAHPMAGLPESPDYGFTEERQKRDNIDAKGNPLPPEQQNIIDALLEVIQERAEGGGLDMFGEQGCPECGGMLDAAPEVKETWGPDGPDEGLCSCGE